MTKAVLIRNAHVFSPDDLGVRDVLMVNGRFLAVDTDLDVKLRSEERR